jgi:hypothetical protein
MMAALILAAPSFASNSQQKATQAPASRSTALKVVTGEVLISTPTYLVLATPSGMKRFEITPQSKITGGDAEGDEVTISYRVVEIPARSAAAANGTQASTSQAKGTKAVVMASRSAQAPAN